MTKANGVRPVPVDWNGADVLLELLYNFLSLARHHEDCQQKRRADDNGRDDASLDAKASSAEPIQPLRKACGQR